MIFGFCEASRQVRRSSEGAGVSAAIFRWCGAAQEIRFTSVRPRRKQKRRILFTFGMSCPWGSSKTSERAQPGPKHFLKFCHKMVRPVCDKILKDHRLPEIANY